MEQELARAEPTRIKVGEVSAWRALECGIGQLMCDEHALHVKPHAPCKQQN
jgi:hypothetical protein